MDEPRDRSRDLALRTAARWLGFAVAGLPSLDIADRAGLFTLLTSPQTLELSLVLVPLLQIAFFAAVGLAASALLRRHRPRARLVFFAGCSLPLLVYVLATGLGLSAAIGLIALCFAFVQLRLAGDVPPR